MNSTLNTESVVVTGASTGIGRASTAALVTAGFHVWATVRSDADAAGLVAEFGEAVTPLIVDLLDDASVRAAGARVVAAGPLRALVNNAGVALPGPLEYLPIETLRRQLDVNVVGQLLVTQVMLPALLAAPGARVVFIGSIAGRISAPVLGAYSASKHAIVGLSSALRAELAPYGVQVALIEPGVIATPIWERSAAAGAEALAAIPADSPRYAAQVRSASRSAANGESGLDPKHVASAVLSAVTQRRVRPRRTVGRDAAIIALITRVLPFSLVYRITAARR